MKKRQWYVLIPILAVVSLLAALLLSGTAESKPEYGACGGCHVPGGSISVTVQSETAVDITYSVSGSTGLGKGEGWGVFNGDTKVASGSGAGQFKVAKDGTTYTVYWVDKDTSTMAGYARASVKTPMPTTTTTVPQTTTTLPPTTSTTVRQATTSTKPQTTPIIQQDDDDDANDDDIHQHDDDDSGNHGRSHGPTHRDRDRHYQSKDRSHADS